MATIKMTKVREVNPDLILFTANGTTAGLRKQASFSRTLPDSQSGTPTVKAGVKVVYDREVKDSQGQVKYVQPSVASISLSFPSAVSVAEVDELVDSLITNWKAQYRLLAQGLLPDTSFDAEVDESITVR